MAKKRSVAKTAAEPPTTSALLLCDEVFTGTVQGKHILHGVVHRVFVQQLPWVIGPFAAYIRVSNVYPNQLVRIDVYDPDDDEPIIKTDLVSPNRSDPLVTHALVMPVPPFPVRRAGRILFRAVHGEKVFAESAIEIKLFPARDEEEGDDGDEASDE